MEPPDVVPPSLSRSPLTVPPMAGGNAKMCGIGMGYNRGQVIGSMWAVAMNISSCCMMAADRSSIGRWENSDILARMRDWKSMAQDDIWASQASRLPWVPMYLVQAITHPCRNF